MTEQLKEDIDEELACLEDFTHGEHGMRITKLRKRLREKVQGEEVDEKELDAIAEIECKKNWFEGNKFHWLAGAKYIQSKLR